MAEPDRTNKMAPATSPSYYWEAFRGDQSKIESLKSKILSGRSRRTSRARRLRDELSKRVGVINGDIRQHLPVDGDAALGQALDKSVVTHSVLATARADAGNPEAAELPLLVSAVAVG